MHQILAGVVLVIWLLTGWKMYTDWDTCCAGEQASATTSIADPNEAPLDMADTATVMRIVDICQGIPICFIPDRRNPVYSENFDRYRDSLAGLVQAGQKLRIIGLYSPGENNHSSFENLGEWRSNLVKEKFQEVLDEDELETGAQLTVGGEESPDKVRISVVGESAPSLPTSTLIYFAFNSTDKLNDDEVESYLDQVSDRVKESGEIIQLDGHTDDIGEMETNQNLARERAAVIREYLLSKGVPDSQIRIQSYGETRPVASNATEMGRSKNRRVELKVQS